MSLPNMLWFRRVGKNLWTAEVVGDATRLDTHPTPWDGQIIVFKLYLCDNRFMERTSSLLRAARKSNSLTQIGLAQKSRVHQGNISEIENGRDLSVSTFERLLKGTGHGLFALPVRRADVAEVAQRIRLKLKQGNALSALRALIQLNDNLVAEHGLLRGVLGLLEPEPTGRREWDAALAALVSWRLREEGLPLPSWVEKDRFFLSKPTVLEVDSADPIPPTEAIPHEFARRNLLVWEDTFRSV